MAGARADKPEPRPNLEEILRSEPYIQARVSCPAEANVDPARVDVLATRILQALKTLSQVQNFFRCTQYTSPVRLHGSWIAKRE